MNTQLTKQIVATSGKQTESVAEAIGKKLKGGELIDLVGDLGSGKTTFVRGLAKGAGSPNTITSPTFKISNVYKTPHYTIHHFDFYRLSEPDIMANELTEVMNDQANIIVIEWSDSVRGVLPENRLTITLTPTDEHDRQLTFTYPNSLAYLTTEVH